MSVNITNPDREGPDRHISHGKHPGRYSSIRQTLHHGAFAARHLGIEMRVDTQAEPLRYLHEIGGLLWLYPVVLDYYIWGSVSQDIPGNSSGIAHNLLCERRPGTTSCTRYFCYGP